MNFIKEKQALKSRIEEIDRLLMAQKKEIKFLKKDFKSFAKLEKGEIYSFPLSVTFLEKTYKGEVKVSIDWSEGDCASWDIDMVDPYVEFPFDEYSIIENSPRFKKILSDYNKKIKDFTEYFTKKYCNGKGDQGIWDRFLNEHYKQLGKNLCKKVR